MRAFVLVLALTACTTPAPHPEPDGTGGAPTTDGGTGGAGGLELVVPTEEAPL